MIPLEHLPPDVATYLRQALAAIDWQAVRGQVPDLCKDCPAKGPAPAAPLAPPSIDDIPPCYSCPYWSYTMGLFDLEHWK